MPFPYSYKSSFEIENTESYDLDFVISDSVNHLKNKDISAIEFQNSNISFISNNALFKFNYHVNFVFDKKENIIIEYEIKLEQLIISTIIIILIIAFFSSLAMSGFLWFSFIVSVIFYAANLIFIDSYIHKIIKSLPIYKNANPFVDEKLSDEQLDWIKDENKCSGCGEIVTKYDNICPECGLKISNEKFAIPLDVTKYQNKRFKYHYKDKKNDT
ncbi:MAG: zinc ribbon domain-containing protein [Bacteroidales bacterium]|nr:zinc ribbon domain-containing protein [Bacteroidales bacterium]MBN2757769.1 zinc ribbon domain-containing protein [Bacteroidales bacterium]